MAKQIRVTLVSDLTEEVLAEGDGETVNFAIDGINYEMDLSKTEAQTMRELFSEYSDRARRVSKFAAPSARKSASAEETKKIRAWAAENGIEVSPRGRISADVKEKYRLANG